MTDFAKRTGAGADERRVNEARRGSAFPAVGSEDWHREVSSLAAATAHDLASIDIDQMQVRIEQALADIGERFGLQAVFFPIINFLKVALVVAIKFMPRAASRVLA